MTFAPHHVNRPCRCHVHRPCTGIIYIGLVQVSCTHCTSVMYTCLVQVSCTQALYMHNVHRPCTGVMYTCILQVSCTHALYRCDVVQLDPVSRVL